MFNRYHHAYQINQDKVQKSLFKSLFIVMKLQTTPPPLSSRHINLECVRILKIVFYVAFAIRFTYCTDTTCITQEAKKQRSGAYKAHTANDPVTYLIEQVSFLYTFIVC